MPRRREIAEPAPSQRRRDLGDPWRLFSKRRLTADKRLKAILVEDGCTFVRQDKGDHETWESPIRKRRLMVDGLIKSRHWANYTFKQAGSPKVF